MNDGPLHDIDPQIHDVINREKIRLNSTLELIASENFASPAIMEAQGSILTNKYAEGYPMQRYYGGCKYIDMAESLAIERARDLFGAEHVNVQPHSGSQANMAVYMALLKPGDRIMGMKLSHGGHLTHGSTVNFSGIFFQNFPYGLDEHTETLNMDRISAQAFEIKPRLIIAGGSSYPRRIDFSLFRNIADDCGAYLMADIAHIAGLVAAGEHPSPIPYCDIVTTTTHKTLRGPRGGMIMCRREYADRIDKAVFPGSQGGPLMHVIAAKAVCFKEAMSDDFGSYQRQVVQNARSLAEEFLYLGYRLVSGGTDTHLFLVDLRPKGIAGKDAEDALDEAGISVNKNQIPFDDKGANVTSGIRIGTPAVTTRGMKCTEMKTIARLVNRVLENIGNKRVYAEARQEVGELCNRFPLYVHKMDFTN
ncbi:serine hydroxymethyltransferase [bacterium]|nr:serine hydroxymethyltransferase [bacterium]